MSPSERRMVAYPPMKNVKIAVAQAWEQGVAKSDILKNILSVHCNSLSPEEQQRLMRVYDKLSPAEKKYPSK